MSETAASVEINEGIKTEKSAAIVSPFVDFLLVGGITFFIFPFLYFLPSANALPESFILALLYGNFVINYPHFMSSYQLLYNNYHNKITSAVTSLASKIRLIISGIIVPIALLAILLYGFSLPTRDFLGHTANAMFFLTGWHYSKQGYGILMALSVREKIFFNDIEKKVLLINVYIVWLYAWITFQWSLDGDIFHDIPFKTLPISDEFMTWAKTIMVAWTMGMILFLVKCFDRHPKLSINGFVAYFSTIYLWVLIAPYSAVAFLVVPALHSIQYNFMVLKLVYEKEKAKLKERYAQSNLDSLKTKLSMQSTWKRVIPFIVISLIGVPALFYVLPVYLDNTVAYNTQEFGSQAFFFMSMIFLNIHHYFIDFAIWRKDNPEMGYLFK